MTNTNHMYLEWGTTGVQFLVLNDDGPYYSGIKYAGKYGNPIFLLNPIMFTRAV